MRLLRLATAYSDLKKGRPVPRGNPIRLWIETSSRCNLGCPLCLNRELKKAEKGDMDFDLFQKVVDEAADFALDAYLHHRGEPLQHPRIVEMVGYAKKRGLRSRIHTNGTLLTRDLSRGLIENQLDQLTVSLDTPVPHLYKESRPGAAFDQVLANVRVFLEERKRLGKRRPRMHLLLMGEKSKCPDVGIRLGKYVPDGYAFRTPHNWAGNLDGGLPVPDGEIGRCTFPWYAMIVLFDGRVCLCPQDFFGKRTVGSVRESTLLDIWRSGHAAQIRLWMVEGRFMEEDPCLKCDRIRRKSVLGIPVEYFRKFLWEMIR